MMNKQEAIEKLQSEAVNHYSETSGWFKEIKLDIVTDIVNQLNEPEKPVVPQFVADWYEEHKEDLEYNLYRLCINFHERKLYGDLYEWFRFDKNKPIEVLVLMNKYGYEIKKEKLYTVELPSPNDVLGGHFTLRRDTTGKVVIERHTCESWKKSEDNQLTEAQIKKDFAWAWRFAEEVEEND